MTTIRAVLRPLRLELAGVAGIVALLGLAAAVVTLRLATLDVPPACLDTESLDPACLPWFNEALQYQDFSSNWLTAVAGFAVYVPALAGIVLGIATVAKELDQRTAVLAWSVGPSRRTWLLQRTALLAGVIVLIGAFVWWLIEQLWLLRGGGAEIQPAFETLPTLGAGPMVLGLSAFGVSVMVGAMLGRLLPTVLAAGALVLFTGLLIGQLNDRLMDNETLVVEAGMAIEGRPVASMLRTPDGAFIDWGQAFPDYAEPNTGELRPGVIEMLEVVPIEIYPQVAARFLLLHLVVALTTLTLAFVVVERRSP
jgi:hypothetical protein